MSVRKTRKRILLVLMVAAVVVTSVIFTAPAQAAQTTNPAIFLNGKRMTGVDAVLTEGVTWVKLRSFSETMGNCTIAWDNGTRTATVKASGLEITAKDGSGYIVANGRYLYTGEAVKIFSNSSMYIPVRLLAKAYGLDVVWNPSDCSVMLTSASGPIMSGDSYYDYGSLYWLSHIIHAESGTESLLGKIAVGNVVLNRVAKDEYPNTIYEVIFDNRYAVQFSPTASGTIYNTPSQESVIAAKICLEGYSLSSDIVYFFQPYLATTTWIQDNCTYVFTIGAHRFYS